MKNKFSIYCSSGYNWYVAFTGTYSECLEEFEKHIGYYESKDGYIS